MAFLEYYEAIAFFSIGLLAVTFSKYYYCFAPWVGIIHLFYVASGIYFMKGKYTRNNFWENGPLVKYLVQAVIFDSLWLFVPTACCPTLCGEGACPTTTTTKTAPKATTKTT